MNYLTAKLVNVSKRLIRLMKKFSKIIVTFLLFPVLIALILRPRSLKIVLEFNIREEKQ